MTAYLIPDHEIEQWAKVRADDAGHLARTIVAERERHGWQPISQVNPVDGLIVVGYGEYRERDGFSPAFMRWYDSVAGWSVNGMPFYPTHFKPLPSPPKP